MHFVSYASGKNHWSIDPDLRQVISLYQPSISEWESGLHTCGSIVGKRAYRLGYYIDQHANPVHIMHDEAGKRVDRVLVSADHRSVLKDLAFINRPPYENGSWLLHFAYGFILADPGFYCTLIVTNQTAYVIHKYAPEQSEWLPRLLDGEAWGATWMTENQGGSDLGANSTIARNEDDMWKLFGGDKYFASNAGFADIVVVTARPEGAIPGPKGLALFLVPQSNPAGELNFKLRRIKQKSATRAVPTGEVELDGSEAYLVGEADQGIYYTMETLTVSRFANAIGAVGLSRKAQIESILRCMQRHAFGKPIIEHPLIRWDLTDLSVRIAGGLALTFHAIDQFNRVWHEIPPYSPNYHYARFLSHLVKNRTATHAAECTRLAMEIFGGLGFLEEYPLSRLHREALVTSIWEGTSNIQALDMLEAMHKKSAHEYFLDELNSLLNATVNDFTRSAQALLNTTLEHLDIADLNKVQWRSKHALDCLADAAIVGLLYKLADQNGERFAKLAELYATRYVLRQPYPDWVYAEDQIWAPESITTA